MEPGWILGIVVGALAWVQIIVGFRMGFQTSEDTRRSIEESERSARGA